MNGTLTSQSAVVVDSSLVVDLIAGVPGVVDAASRFGNVQFHAPYLIDLEYVSSLRSKLFQRRISAAEAAHMLDMFLSVPIIWHPHRPFLARVWQLRDNINPYDACYVALADLLDIPLLTRDARLARASGHAARIEYID